MSTATHAAVARGSEQARAVGVSADTVAVVAVGSWFVLLALLTWGTWGDPTMDLGYDLLAASRTAQGELPFVDYAYYYGPLSPLLLGGIYAIAGAGVAPAVGLGLLVSALAAGLTYRIARVFACPLGAGLAAALTTTAALTSANNSYTLPHSTSAPLATVLALAAMLALISSDDLRRRGLAAAAGGALGLIALTRPDYAVAVGGAITLWVAAGNLRARAGRGAALRRVLWLAAPALALPALIYGAFLVRVPVHDLLFENLYPKDQLEAAGNVVLSNNAPWTASSFAVLAAKLALYAGGAAVLTAAGVLLERGGVGRRLVLAAAGVAVVCFLAVLAARPDTVRYYLEFAYAWLPAGAWVAAGVLASRQGAGVASDRAALLVVLVLAFVATLTYANFAPFPNAENPSAVAYAMPFAAIFLAWLHLDRLARGSPGIAALGAVWLAVLVAGSAGLAVHDARQETASVHGPGGSLTAHPADAAALQQALDLVVRETRPGDPVLMAPQLTSLYVLARRNDPLPQLALLPGALATATDERAAIARMADVRLVVTDRTPLTLYGHGSFGTTFDFVLARWLRRDFVRIASPQGEGPHPRIIDVWERNSA